jgi:hypothetical protein
MLDWLIRFQNMDRRLVFLGMAIAILIPMVAPLKLPFEVDKEVQSIYDRIEELPAGSTVLLSADFDPASLPELGPFFNANLHHLFRSDIKIVVVTLWATAPPLITDDGTGIPSVARQYGKKYGEDYAFLGYKEGRELVVKSIGQNIPQQFPKDFFGTPVGELPVMSGIRQAKDFPLMVLISAGAPGMTEYVLQIQGQYNLDMVGSCTAVSGPDFIPFYRSGQVKGLSMGMPGSAQYEKLVWMQKGRNFDGGGPPDTVTLDATAAMDVLNVGHLFIILLILFGNVAYFITRRVEEG